jgi:hypothetical protein
LLTIRLTAALAGIEVSGDLLDLQALHDALSALAGDEQTGDPDYEMSTRHFLTICQELNEAWQGRRQVVFAANGVHPAMLQSLKILAPQRNVYFAIRIRMPDALFAVMALNDFLEIYGRSCDIPDLDPRMQQVRTFQTQVTCAMQSALDPSAAGRLARLIYGRVPRYRAFCTQYLAALNQKYLSQDKEKRRQQIVPLARRLDLLADDYQSLVAELSAAAADLRCPVADLEPVIEPPALEDEEW